MKIDNINALNVTNDATFSKKMAIMGYFTNNLVNSTKKNHTKTWDEYAYHATLDDRDYENMLVRLFQRPRGNGKIEWPILPMRKASFLVHHHNKYFNILTESIAFFYLRNDLTHLYCFNQNEYFINHSLKQIQDLVCPMQFYRVNRQYLIKFNAIKDVEHYFARKLLVNLIVPTKDKLIISKENSAEFLAWLDNR